VDKISDTETIYDNILSSHSAARKIYSLDKVKELKGIVNLGITCYLNAAVQRLARNSEYEVLLTKQLIQRAGESKNSFV